MPEPDQKRQRRQSSEQLLQFFQRNPNYFLSRLVTMDETWLYYCDQWSGGIAAHPAPPQKNPRAKILWKSSRLDFMGSRRHSPHYLPTGQTMKAECYSSLLVQLKDILKEKRRGPGRSPSGSCSYTTMPRLTGHLQRRRDWPTWASHPILRIWPRRNTTRSLDWKKKTIERSPFFVRRGGHLRRGDLVGRTTF